MRAYNPATRKQIGRTYRHPSGEAGQGIRKAREQLAILVADIAAGKYGIPVEPDKARTLGQLLDEWIDHGKTRGRSPNTIYGYESKTKMIKAGPLGDVELSKLTTRDLDRWYNELLTSGMSLASVAHYHRVIRAALNQAEKWKMLVENPADDVDLVGAQAPVMNVPTIDQARTLVLRAAETASADLGPILLFAMLTGMRRGELCGVQWSDIEWNSARLTVRRSVWQVRSTWGIKDPKTHQIRTIAIDPAAVALLRARETRAVNDADGASVPLSPDAFVWSAQVDGLTPRTPNSLTRAFHRLCQTLEAEALAADPPRAETWDVRFHDLRHLSATEMVGQGMDPRTVASRLGHSKSSMTLSVYAHAIEARDRDAAAGLGQALACPSS